MKKVHSTSSAHPAKAQNADEATRCSYNILYDTILFNSYIKIFYSNNLQQKLTEKRRKSSYHAIDTVIRLSTTDDVTNLGRLWYIGTL